MDEIKAADEQYQPGGPSSYMSKTLRQYENDEATEVAVNEKLTLPSNIEPAILIEGTEIYTEARRVLEEASRTPGPNEDFEHLLAVTNHEQARQEQKQAEIREASVTPTKSASPVSVAVPALQPDDEPFKQESERKFRPKLAPVLPGASRKSSKRLVFLFGAAFVVIVALATSGLLPLRHRGTPRNHTEKNPVVVTPVPALVPTYMAINATPWARVVQVQDGEGKSIRLPEDSTTPLRLDGLKAGRYKVTLTGPNGDNQIVYCSVSGNDHLCILQVETPDIQEVMTEANP